MLGGRFITFRKASHIPTSMFARRRVVDLN
jgi:hypothetical protein